MLTTVCVAPVLSVVVKVVVAPSRLEVPKAESAVLTLSADDCNAARSMMAAAAIELITDKTDASTADELR